MFVKWRKTEILKRKFMAQKIYHLVGHKIPNITPYFIKDYYLVSRDIE